MFQSTSITTQFLIQWNTQKEKKLVLGLSASAEKFVYNLIKIAHMLCSDICVNIKNWAGQVIYENLQKGAVADTTWIQSTITSRGMW